MSLKQKIISGVFWQGVEKIGTQGINFVISVVLARLLAPKEFGVAALMMVFLLLCNVVIDSGFGNALIQKKEATQADFCSVFFINIVLGATLYGVMFFAAPWIARFYDYPELTLYLRVSSLSLIIGSFMVIQRTLLIKQMMFYLNFRINWTTCLLSGSVGILMAYHGIGVWALIIQNLVRVAVTCLLLWGLVKWRPQLCFDWERTKSLFKFGWKFLVSSFLDTLYNDIYSVVIGRIANLTSLGFYNRGKSVSALGMGAVTNTISSVLFPAFSQIQDDKVKMCELAKRGIRNIMFFVSPVLTLLFILADPLVRVLFTEKWLPCVIYLRLCCITFFFWPLHATNLQVISASGRSDVFLILEIIKKVQAALVIIVTYRYGVVIMVAGEAAMGIVSFFENSWFNRKLINYPPWRQLWDILPVSLIAMISGGGAYGGTLFVTSPWCKLLAGGSAFVALYVVGAVLFRQFPADILNLLRRRT